MMNIERTRVALVLITSYEEPGRLANKVNGAPLRISLGREDYEPANLPCIGEREAMTATELHPVEPCCRLNRLSTPLTVYILLGASGENGFYLFTNPFGGFS